MKAEALNIQATNWKNLLAKLIDDRKLNPKTFWSKIKQVVNKNPSSNFQITDNGTRQGNLLVSSEDIESNFKTEWRGHFSAPSPVDIDPDALIAVNNFHRQHPEIQIPHRFIALERLDHINDPDNVTIRPFKPTEIWQIIKDFNVFLFGCVQIEGGGIPNPRIYSRGPPNI